MHQTKTKRRLPTKKELEKEREERKRKRAQEVAQLDAPDLCQEAKELLVGIRRGLRDMEEGRGYTIEEVKEILFGEDGLCK